MTKCSMLMTLSFVSFSVLAVSGCSSTKALSNPCDVLVAINPLPATNTYLVKNDRQTAEQIAKHRGRYQANGCPR